MCVVFPCQAGALLACGIVNSGVRNECDPALALLSDYVLHSSNIMRLGSVVGFVNLSRGHVLIHLSFLFVFFIFLNPFLTLTFPPL